MFRRAIVLIAAMMAGSALADDFELTVLHTNDLHAHIEPSRVSGTLLGGYDRQATLIKKLRAGSKHSILLNGGDTFQGTLFFNAYHGLADAAIMNQIGYDGMAAGNHEFDLGPKPFADFIKAVTFPVLAANLDCTEDEHLKGLIKKSVIQSVDGQKIGLVGAITPDLPDISSPGKNVKLIEIVSSIQQEVDKLTRSGINKIILVSHVGYSEEKELARKLKGVDLIVGGHSHTLLGQCILPEQTIEGRGDYPTVIRNAEGKTTLVTQAWDWGKVVGQIRIVFDEAGDIKSWRDAKPFPVHQGIDPDPVVASMITAFSKPIESLKNQPVGHSSDEITRGEEMANVITDGVFDKMKSQGALAAFVNIGGVRAGVSAGPITYGDLIEVQPFNNTIVLLDLTGEEMRAALQHGVDNGGGFLFVSTGSGYTVENGKVSNIILSGQKVVPAGTYRVALPNFTANGGDAHAVLAAAKGRRVDTGTLDIDCLIDWFKKTNPVTLPKDVRIVRK